MKFENSQVAQLCRSLSQLLHAGISLADGLHLLAQEETGETRQCLSQMGKQLDCGCPLAQAMKESGAFSNQASGMAALGEASGKMEEALASLADYYDQRCRMERQVRQALTYPSLTLLLMLGVIGVLLVKVLPIFDQVYASLGSRLTGMAAGLLYLGRALEAGLPVLLVLLLLFAGAAALYGWNAAFRKAVTAAYQKRFGDRGIARKFNNARFARGLAMGLGSGLTLEEALTLAENLLAEIPGAARRCRDCGELLSDGAELGEALEQTGLLPPAKSRMLSVGLRGGNADQVMANIAQRLSEEAEEALEGAVAKVEPAMVLACSVLVGGILLSVMLPLVNIMSTIG